MLPCSILRAAALLTAALFIPNLAAAMKVRSLLLLFVILQSALVFLLAAPPPELTVLRQQYEQSYAERVITVHEASVSALNVKFTAALDTASTAAQQAGKLDDVLAIQEDKKRLAENLAIPADDEKTPETLKKLRTIYREQVRKLEDARAAAIATLLPGYQTKLQDLETMLTKAGRIEEAKELRVYREGLGGGAPSLADAARKTTGPAPSPAAIQKGGVLKGLGQFMFGNQPVDLSQAEGIQDFVEIKVSHMGWIARRANGEVHYQIQANGDKTKGIANAKTAVRVCATEGKPFFAICEDGTVEMLGTQFDKVSNPFPREARDVTEVDVGSGVHLILHRDGNCSVHGKRQQEFITGLKLRDPGIIPNVAAFTAARYMVFFLMKDGSVTATNDFRNQPPEWADLPAVFRRGMRSVAVGAGSSNLAAITLRGEVIDGKGEKIAKNLKDIVEVKAGGDAVIAKNLDGEWHIAKPGDAEMAKLLATALATPRIIDIDLHNYDNSGDGKLVSRAVLWIEAAP